MAIGKSSIASLGASLGATTATSVVITTGTSGAAIPASSSVTLTISGFKMGAATAGAVGIIVQTSSDSAASAALASGAIYGARTNMVTSGNWVYSTVTDVPISFTGNPKTTHSTFLAIPAFWSLAMPHRIPQKPEVSSRRTPGARMSLYWPTVWAFHLTVWDPRPSLVLRSWPKSL